MAGMRLQDRSRQRFPAFVLAAAEAVAAETPKAVTDPAPDSSASVTGLLTYRGVQEMVVSAGMQRRQVRVGRRCR